MSRGFVYYYKSAPRGMYGLPEKLPRGWKRAKSYPERQYVAEIDEMAYGEIECFRPLEPWEVVFFDLIAAPVE